MGFSSPWGHMCSATEAVLQLGGYESSVSKKPAVMEFRLKLSMQGLRQTQLDKCLSRHLMV